MELEAPPLALTRPGLPLAATAEEPRRAEKAARDFEALLMTRLLKSARAARLGDDLMGSNETVRDLVDEQRGRLMAQAAPLGLARLIARGAAR